MERTRVTLNDGILTAKDFGRMELPAKEKIIDPWLTEQSITLLSGYRGVGKTMFGLGIVDAVSRGESLGPWQVLKPVPSLYLDGEMPTQDIQQRICAFGLNENYAAPVYIYSDAFMTADLGLPRAHLANKKWREAMKTILTSYKIKLFIIDNLASLASGLDENSKRDYDPINQWMLELRFRGISTILLHHVNKSGGQRGTSAREDNIDISITLKQPYEYTAEDGARFICHFTKSRVPTSDLSLLSDIEFKLIEESGQTKWAWGDVKGRNKTLVLQASDEGLGVQAIAETTGLSKGYVSKVRNQAIKDGLLTAKGKLTQSGILEMEL